MTLHRDQVRRAALTLGLTLLAPLWGTSLAHARDTRPPLQDRDGDGVPDDLDRCPDRAGLSANLGCPDRDQDNDGIVDRLDGCPTVAGAKENQGCPGEAPPPPPVAPPGVPITYSGAPQSPAAASNEVAALRGKRFAWPEPISFEVGQDALTPRGLASVESTARVIQSHPELRRLMIEGHVDEPGNTAVRARDLSKRRADAVKKVLVEKGVAAERLRTSGFGYSRLLDRSETPAAAKINNRIEIIGID